MNQNFSTRTTPPAFRLIVLCVPYMIVSLLVLHLFMDLWSFRGDNEKFAFNKILDRTAYKPFIYRALSPWLVNRMTDLAIRFLPEAVKAGIIANPPLKPYIHRSEMDYWDERIGIAYHVTYLYLFACLMALLFAGRALVTAAFRAPPLMQDYAPAVALLFLPVTFLHGGYFYDFPELLWMTLCLIALLKSNWYLYYPLYALAILNKESNVLIILFFAAVQYGKLSKRDFFLHLAAQLLVGGALYAGVKAIYADYPGYEQAPKLKRNIRFWTTEPWYFLFTKIYSPFIQWPRVQNIFSLIFMGFLFFYRWGEKPAALKRLFLIMLAVLIPLCFFHSKKDEVRNYSLIFPAVYLLSFHTVGRLYMSEDQFGNRS